MKQVGDGARPSWELLEATPDAMLVVNARRDIVFANKHTERMFGYSGAELREATLELLIPARYHERHVQDFITYFTSPRARSMGSGLELFGRRRDGQEFRVDVSLSPVSIVGEVLIAAALRDISERARADTSQEEAQREAERMRTQLAGLLDNIPDYVVKVDTEGVIQFANRVQEAHLTREQVVGTSFVGYLPKEQHANMHAALQRVFTSGETSILTVSTTGPEAQLRWLESRVGPVWRANAIVGAVIISRDITDKQRVESLLVASERMASMGTLAAGVAHEINNPLAAVIGNLELAADDVIELSTRLDIPASLLEMLQDARAAADRVRIIVRDLKIFSRHENEQTGPVDVQQVMESTLRVIWNEIRHRARLVKLYGNIPWIEANETRLGQVFINLIMNAVQSIKEGYVESNEIRISTRLDPSGEVVIEIADTGSGITPEVRKRLFTPFFTTKRPGEGAGLGLSICQRIITDLKGRIEVESHLGTGTTFRVHLPVARAEPALDAAPPATTSKARRRGQILAVDDEPTIGRVLARALLGEHDVITCVHARDALDRLAAGAHFDVILCDLMMPDLTGLEFLEELQRIAPSHVERVIFVTGGAFTEAARQFLERVPNRRIDKPFDTRQLRALVNDRIR